jgi:hypothetical protein
MLDEVLIDGWSGFDDTDIDFIDRIYMDVLYDYSWTGKVYILLSGVK